MDRALGMLKTLMGVAVLFVGVCGAQQVTWENQGSTENPVAMPALPRGTKTLTIRDCYFSDVTLTKDDVGICVVLEGKGKIGKYDAIGEGNHTETSSLDVVGEWTIDSFVELKGGTTAARQSPRFSVTVAEGGTLTVSDSLYTAHMGLDVRGVLRVCKSVGLASTSGVERPTLLTIGTAGEVVVRGSLALGSGKDVQMTFKNDGLLTIGGGLTINGGAQGAAFESSGIISAGRVYCQGSPTPLEVAGTLRLTESGLLPQLVTGNTLNCKDVVFSLSPTSTGTMTGTFSAERTYVESGTFELPASKVALGELTIAEGATVKRGAMAEPFGKLLGEGCLWLTGGGVSLPEAWADFKGVVRCDTGTVTLASGRRLVGTLALGEGVALSIQGIGESAPAVGTLTLGGSNKLTLPVGIDAGVTFLKTEKPSVAISEHFAGQERWVCPQGEGYGLMPKGDLSTYSDGAKAELGECDSVALVLKGGVEVKIPTADELEAVRTCFANVSETRGTTRVLTYDFGISGLTCLGKNDSGDFVWQVRAKVLGSSSATFAKGATVVLCLNGQPCASATIEDETTSEVPLTFSKAIPHGTNHLTVHISNETPTL